MGKKSTEASLPEKNRVRSYFSQSIIFFLLILAALSVHAEERGPQGSIRVGIFQFEPFNFMDSSGTAQGFYPDLLREIVKDETWKVEFVPVSWAEGLEGLQKENIDLMVSVAYSAARAEIMDYSYEPVVELWGQVFLRPDGKSKNINDLDGKRVGVMRRDISGSNFIETAAKLDVHCEIVEFASHGEVFKAVQREVVEAGIAPQHFGLRHADQYNLVGSSILFSPFSIYFASKKGTQHELLSHIDAHLSGWKRDKGSYYYQRLNYWLRTPRFDSQIPTWLLYTVISISVVMLLFAGFTMVLKRTVNNRTRELTRSGEMLLEAHEIASLGRWELDLKDNRLTWSDSIYPIFEMSSETHSSSYDDFFEFVHPDDRALLHQVYQNSVKNRTPFNIEHRLLMSDGRIKWLSQIGRIEYNSEGSPVRSVGTVQDITERRKAADELLESREVYRTLVHTAIDGFWLLDDKGRFLDVNETYCQMSGYSVQELMGMRISDVEAIEMAEETEGRMRKIIDHGEDRFESRHRRKDGSFYDVEVSVQFQAGKDAVFVVFLRDISGIKQAQEEKENLQNQLLQARKIEAVGTLAGGIAHDFNNILAAIIGFSELAKDNIPSDNPAQEDLDTVLKSCTRAADLVRQILAFSHKSSHQLQSFMPHLIVKEALKMLRSSFPTTLYLEEKIDIADEFILADPTNVHQIVVNLCTNAFHAMKNEKGTLTVSLYRKNILVENIRGRDVSPGPFVVLSVSDTGCGMDKKTIQRIFEPYFTTKKIGEGTGLGLAVIHGIIKDYNGFIEVESEPGRGSTFLVHLPVYDEGTPEEKIIKREFLPQGTERILIVDDESSLASLQKTILERLGYKVTSTESSREALGKIGQDHYQFDLVITDQSMPDLSGVELAEEILKINPDMPIILCTGYSSAVTEEGALAAGIRKYVKKPVTRSALARTVRTVLDGEE